MDKNQWICNNFKNHFEMLILINKKIERLYSLRRTPEIQTLIDKLEIQSANIIEENSEKRLQPLKAEFEEAMRIANKLLKK